MVQRFNCTLYSEARNGKSFLLGPGLTPGLVFIQVVRNNVSWRQGSEMAGCCAVNTYTMGTSTNSSISVSK